MPNKRRIATNNIHINVVEKGEGPLVLFVHGFPELSHSWRHQIEAVSAAGFKAAAMDVRGYGESDKPWDVSAYEITEIVEDIKGLIAELSEDNKAVLVGHDWGAPIVYYTTLLAPEVVRGVVGMASTYMPPGEERPTDIFNRLFAEKFFYILYFQTPHIAETELGGCTEQALRSIYYYASGEAEENLIHTEKPDSAGFLDGMPDPGRNPSFFLEKGDFEAYVTSFAQGGWRGPINRYRNVDGD